MGRLVLALVLAAVVVGIALALQRRRAPEPTASPPRYEAPTELVRADFTRPEAPWLVAVFTSATCSTCEAVWSKAALLESDQVAVQEVEATRDRDLHRRYGIGAVPIAVLAGPDGEVGASFMGPVSSTHLWAALAELREPGSVPPGCDGQGHDHGDDPAD